MSSAIAVARLLSWMIRDKVQRNFHLQSYQIAPSDSIVPLPRRLEAIHQPGAGISLIAVGRACA